MMTIPKVRINLEVNNLVDNNLEVNNLVVSNPVKRTCLFVIDFQTLKKYGSMHLVGIRHTILAMSLQRLVSKSVLTMPLAKMA